MENDKESGRKKIKIKDLNVEGRKITDQQTIAETINAYFVVIAENVKKQS
jgi:hypothetical protein